MTIRSGRQALIAAVVMGGLWSLLASVPVRAQSEETLKSQFILNFARFTTWPSAAFASPSSPLIVGFVSSPDLADAFDRIATGKNVNGRELKVKKFDSVAAVDDSCQVVVAAPGALSRAVAAKIKGKHVLLVGQDGGFLDAGGTINLIVEGGKISFEVNLASAHAASLELDQKLKALAKSVKGA
ncbi:MAG TPA: YfiR family protein [Vicinamibacterales bacterium]|nr:YfiR family protein [Vicinamibacterales bacterium]